MFSGKYFFNNFTTSLKYLSNLRVVGSLIYHQVTNRNLLQNIWGGLTRGGYLADYPGLVFSWSVWWPWAACHTVPHLV